MTDNVDTPLDSRGYLTHGEQVPQITAAVSLGRELAYHAKPNSQGLLCGWFKHSREAREYGLDVLGTGNWSVVVWRPDLGPYVVKISRGQDDSYAGYAAWCRAHQHLPCVPRIHYVWSCPDTGHVMYVLDRLEPLDDIDAEDISNVIACPGWVSEDVMEYQQYNYPDLPAARETFEAIEFAFWGLADFDLHHENVMQDAEGRLVITDPLSYVRDQDNDEGEDDDYNE